MAALSTRCDDDCLEKVHKKKAVTRLAKSWFPSIKMNIRKAPQKQQKSV